MINEILRNGLLDAHDQGVTVTRTSTDVENPPESSVAVTINEYTCGWRKSSKSSSFASLTMPDDGPILNVPAPWPCAFNV